ncbi:MAG: hypothetical protein IJZ81_03620 [Clostridia bacterium]|nr:hypothetical protein [Clostridia bacterium]
MNVSADVITRNISMYNLIDRYGLKLNRRGAMCCPFHREKTPSFKVYKNGSRFKCFGCGAGGDVITFAMRYYNLNYGQAITRLASEFGIPVVGERSLTIKERVKIQETRKKRKQKEEFLKSEGNRLFDVWVSACDEVARLKNEIVEFAPKTVGEPYHERYCKALKLLPVSIYNCDMAEIKLREFEERRLPKNERDNSGTSVQQRGLSERTRAV